MKRLLMVGAGVSTVSLLKNLTKFKDLETLNIDIVDSQSQFGRGNAYIKDSTHLMSNVPVHEMALDDDPNHLADWLDDKGIDYDRFCSRESFGQYMHDVLTDIIERHENVRYKYGTIDKIDYDGKVYRTSLGGKIIEYDYVYLGIGMLEYAAVLHLHIGHAQALDFIAHRFFQTQQTGNHIGIHGLYLALYSYSRL